MSGIDDYTRFYWDTDVVSTNIAWSSQAYYNSGTNTWYSLNPDSGLYDLPNNTNDYPHSIIGQSYTGYSAPTGVFGGTALGIKSYDPSAVPTRSRVYQSVNDRANPLAVKGLFACLADDYTIDFWVRINVGASGKQPILTDTQIDWGIYYEDGVLAQKQGSTSLISCLADLSDYSYHHIEFNRSSGVNRIFVDGVLKELVSNVWSIDESIQNLSLISINTYYIGCPSNTYRNVDYDFDGIRFSSNLARHIYDFTPPTSVYTRDAIVTEISSPTDAIISFGGILSNSIEIDQGSREYSIQNGFIKFEGELHNSLEVYKEPFSFPWVISKLEYNEPLQFSLDCNGVYSPAVQDIEIVFDDSLEIVVELEGSGIYERIEGTIYDLINNTEQIPISLSTTLVLDAGTSVTPTYTFTFRNQLVDNLETDFSFLNALHIDLEFSFSSRNSLMEGFEMLFTFPNQILPYNELIKDFAFMNRLLGTIIFEEYDTFYYSERHGV